MARKCKIWMSSSIFDDDFLYDVEGVNPNTREYHKIYTQSQFNQIKTIKEKIETLLDRHKEIELEGFYISSGARYYVALSLKSEFKDYLSELSVPNSYDSLIRLRNAPNTCYSRIDLNEEYERVKEEAERYNDSMKIPSMSL